MIFELKVKAKSECLQVLNTLFTTMPNVHSLFSKFQGKGKQKQLVHDDDYIEIS